MVFNKTYGASAQTMRSECAHWRDGTFARGAVNCSIWEGSPTGDQQVLETLFQRALCPGTYCRTSAVYLQSKPEASATSTTDEENDFPWCVGLAPRIKSTV